jgi:ketosteroid isomerase-like protein
MSGENVALARSAIGDLGALFELFADDIVWDNTQYTRSRLPEFMGVEHGKQAVAQQMRRYVGAWADFRFDVEDIIDAGASVVLVIHETMRGKSSGVPAEHCYCQVWTFQDGRIVRGTSYSGKAEALEALGMRE